MNNKSINTIRILLVIFITSSSYLISKDDAIGNHSIRIVIPKVALLGIEAENSKNIILKMISPIETGDPLQGKIDNSIWLNVTSIVNSGSARAISVKIDEPIKGIDLNVVSNPHSGLGFDSWGTSNIELTLTTNDQILVSGITNTISGNGPYNGYNLQYSAKSNNPNFKEITSTVADEVMVIYTLTQ